MVRGLHAFGLASVIALPSIGGLYSYTISVAWIIIVALPVDSVGKTGGTHEILKFLHITLSHTTLAYAIAMYCS